MSIWTEDEIVQLLRAMKNYPLLYSRARNFSTEDQNEYVAAIQDIHNVVNKPWSVIKTKWINLKSYHKLCYNKQLKTKEKPVWMYYDLMEFAIDSKYAQTAGQEDSEEYPSGDKSENFGFQTDAGGSITAEVRKSVRIAKRMLNRRKSCSALPKSQPRKSTRIAVEENSFLPINEAVENNFLLTKDSYSDYIDLISFKLRDIDQRFGQQEGKVAALSVFECLNRFEMEATNRFLANRD